MIMNSFSTFFASAPSPSPSDIPLTWNEALSGALGSVSLSAWIFLLVPQLIENQRRGSADGISLAFLLVWFAGDVTNLAGALLANLVPTVVALAGYFCVMDFVLVGQCVYYRVVNAQQDERDKIRKRRRSAAAPDADGEVEPLLRRSATNESGFSVSSRGRRRRSSELSSRRRRLGSDRRESLASIVEEGQGKSAWVKNTTSVVLVCVAGAAGWALAWSSGLWTPAPVVVDDGSGEKTPLGAELLGYASAVFYLGARIPQIIKNQRDRSCEGLSLLFFLLSLLGNASYGAGILFHSVQRDYVLTNLPWLIGSLGTMAEDAVIFAQFRAFGDNENRSKSDSGGAAIEQDV